MLFLYLLLIQSLMATDSRSLTGTATGTLPTSGTMTQANWRVEALITGLDTASNGSNREVFNIGGLRVYIPSGTQQFRAEISSPLTQVNAVFPRDPVTDAIPATGNWIIVFEWGRLPNSTSDRILRLSLFDPATSRLVKHYESAPVATGSPTATISGGGVTLGNCCAFGWVRVFSTKFDWRTMQPTGHAAAGDVLRWEFASDSRVDEVLGVTLSGGTFSATPIMLTMPRSQTIRASWPGTVDGSTIGASAWQWRIISRPSGAEAAGLRNETTATPILHSTEPGEYVLGLTATVAGSSYEGTLKVGAVRQNSSGAVDAGTLTKNIIMGPMLRLDSMRYARLAMLRRAAYIYGERFATMETADLDTFLAGTLAVTNGSAAVTGTGTDFTQFACNGTDTIVIRYPVGDGTFGIAPYGVANSACTSTSLTLAANWAFPSASGLQFLRWTATDALRYTEGINYYDLPMGFYQTYHLTGLTEYRDYAQTAARSWWRATANGGRFLMDPSTTHIASRRYPFGGLALWALDLADQGSTTVTINGESQAASVWSTRILKWLNHAAGITGWLNLDNQTPAAKPSDFGKQPREAAYATLHHIICARVCPDSTGTVTVSGTSVTWASGDQFEHYLWYGQTITINGSPYTINASNSRTSLGVSSAPGNGTFAYSVNNQAIHLNKVNTLITSYWLPWQCKSSNPSPRCQTPDGPYRGLDPGSVYAGNGSMPFMESLIPEMLSRAKLLPGFTAGTDLDTVLTSLAAWLKDGAGNGGTTLWVTSTGLDGRTCNHPQYWMLATAGGASDANGNQPDGAACATIDRIRNNRTLSNDYWGAMMYAWTLTGTTAYRDRGDLAGNAFCRDENYSECDGYSGIGMGFPIGSNDWTAATLKAPAELKQLGQGARSSGAAEHWRVNDPYTAGGTTTVRAAVTIPAGSNEAYWETREGRTGTCAVSPCEVTVDKRLGTMIRWTYRNSGTVRARGDWQAIRVE